MTPVLARVIDLWTCPHCLGNGRLTSSTTQQQPGGFFIRRTHQQDCAPCGGTGVNRDGQNGQG